MKLEDFKRYQLIKYNGQRYEITTVGIEGIYVKGFKGTSIIKDLNNIEIIEPLLKECIDLNTLEDLDVSENQKEPFKDYTSEEIASMISFKNTPSFILDLQKEIKENGITYDVYNKLLEILYNFNTKQLSKLFFSTSVSSMGRSEFLMNNNPTLWITHKIKSSYWRNGMYDLKWNDLIKCYNKIKSFNLDKEGFEILLDTTTWYNSKGFSRFNRIYLDGVFSYIIYHKNKPVLNISFSLTKYKKENCLKINQIQCINKKGNRWIFKFGKNYVEQIVYKLTCHFKDFKILLLKPISAISIIEKQYLNDLKSAKESYNNAKSSSLYSEEGVLREKRNLEINIEQYNFFKNQGINSINKTLGYKFKNLRRVRSLDENYSTLKILR